MKEWAFRVKTSLKDSHGGNPLTLNSTNVQVIVGSTKSKCADRKNAACCAALHDNIGTQCKDVPDERVTCPEPVLAYLKHKRWSLPLKRALFQKRGDWCDERAAAQQFRDFAEKNPPQQEFDNGFPVPNTGAVGETLHFFHEISKSNDKGAKSYPDIIPIDPALIDFVAPLPAFPANGVFDGTSDPDFYF